jgi:hypothetical protein
MNGEKCCEQELVAQPFMHIFLLDYSKGEIVKVISSNIVIIMMMPMIFID